MVLYENRVVTASSLGIPRASAAWNLFIFLFGFRYTVLGFPVNGLHRT